MVRSSASFRLSWPPIMFSHSGVLASSKSASHTLAPEFRALIVILRSVGPVIFRCSRTVRSFLSISLYRRQEVSQIYRNRSLNIDE